MFNSVLCTYTSISFIFSSSPNRVYFFGPFPSVMQEKYATCASAHIWSLGKFNTALPTRLSRKRKKQRVYRIACSCDLFRNKQTRSLLERAISSDRVQSTRVGDGDSRHPNGICGLPRRQVNKTTCVICAAAILQYS